jgi:hypothetical protein
MARSAERPDRSGSTSDVLVAHQRDQLGDSFGSSKLSESVRSVGPCLRICRLEKTHQRPDRRLRVQLGERLG